MTATAPSYFLAAVPEPVRVLGLELKPFSIGHYITLKRFGSGFVDEKQRDGTAEEIIFAAVVCHFTYEAFYEFIRQKDFLKQLRALGNRVGVFDRKEKAELLKDYISAASKMPGFSFEDENSSNTGAHWAHSVLAGAVSHCGYSQTEALNAPLQKVLWDFLKHAESNGVIKLFTEEEAKQVAEWEQN